MYHTNVTLKLCNDTDLLRQAYNSDHRPGCTKMYYYLLDPLQINLNVFVSFATEQIDLCTVVSILLECVFKDTCIL